MNAPQLLYWWLVTATLLVGRGEATPARVAAWVFEVRAATASLIGGVADVGEGVPAGPSSR